MNRTNTYTKSLILPFAIAFFALTSVVFVAASNHFTNLQSFTQSELDYNWEADRYFPTAGVTSVSAFGRDNVAQIGIDATNTQPGTFQRTEGIKTVGVNNFGTAVKVDLYIDPTWENQATRAGFWVVGDNGAGARDNWFGIIEFVNSEPCPTPNCSNQGNITSHEGFRVWDSAVGWRDVATQFTYGEWVTLGIELDTSAEIYSFYIDGTFIASGPGGANFIREIFLNSYNYGLDTFPTLESSDYLVNWHAGSIDPTNKSECKKEGYESLGFKNQGQCIRFVETGQDSR